MPFKKNFKNYKYYHSAVEVTTLLKSTNNGNVNTPPDIIHQISNGKRNIGESTGIVLPKDSSKTSPHLISSVLPKDIELNTNAVNSKSNFSTNTY